MEMVINTYNLKQIRKQVITQCINDHPSLTIEEIAKILGISSRTMHRFGVKDRKKVEYEKYGKNTEIAIHTDRGQDE